MPEHNYLRERRKAKRVFNLASIIYPLIERNLYPQYKDSLEKLHLSPKFSVIDIATGSGMLAGAFAERGHQVTGIDFSTKLLDRAAKLFPNIEFKYQDLFELDPVSSPQYDIVSMAYLLHGLSPDLRKVVLNKAAKMAHQYILIFDHGQRGNWIVDFIEFLEGSYYKQFINENHIQVFAAAGLTIVTEFDTSEYGHMWLCKKNKELENE